MVGGFIWATFFACLAVTVALVIFGIVTLPFWLLAILLGIIPFALIIGGMQVVSLIAGDALGL